MEDVSFTIRRTDLKRVLKELQVNRGRFQHKDLVHLLVSSYAVTFKAVGVESEYPVNGTGPGTAQVPIVVLDRLYEMRKAKEMAIRIGTGSISCGAATVRHEAITLGTIPNITITVPIDSSGFELLVIQSVLGDAAAADQGLSTRLIKATEDLQVALSRAASELAAYQVSRSDLELLVEMAVRGAKDATRRSLSN